MATSPIVGSQIICGIDASDLPAKVGVNTSLTPPALLTDIPDRALRDLGKVDIADALPTGTNTIGSVKVTDGTLTATVRDTGGSDSLNVAIVDASGAQVTSFGGGTQYTEGDVDASITGTAAMMEVAANVLQPVQGTVADGLLVNLGANNDVVCSATDLDIRNLVAATDIVTVTGGAGQTADVKVTLDSETVVLGAGTAEIGKLAAGLANIGDVDIASGPTGASALQFQGDIAHDVGNSGNPVQIGGHAVIGGATPTPVAAADRVRAIFNQHGIQYVLAGHPNLITREFDFGTAAQTDLNLAAAVVAADERIYVTRFEALCDNANTVAVSVRAGFGTANVPAASATGVSGMIASHPGIAAGSGIICGGGGGIIAIGGLGEEPRLTSSAATSGNLHVVITYFLVDETP